MTIPERNASAQSPVPSITTPLTFADIDEPPTEVLLEHSVTQTELQPAEQLISSAITRRLYTSHFLSTWNSRSFEFGATLFLATIYPGTLLYLSIYALVRSASAILFAPAVGYAIDKQERLSVVKLSIVGQRIAVILSCVGFYFLSEFLHISWHARQGVFAILILLACVEKLCSILNLVSIERDWVVVIAGHHEPNLQKLNARMRRIDLFCKLAGPLFIALVDGASSKMAILLMLGLNIPSLAVEYFAIAQVYKVVPELSTRTPSLTSNGTSPPQISSTLRSHVSSIPRTYKSYFTHPAFLPSFSLSLLYLTVLTLGGQMVTYLLSTGYYTPFTIALVRTLSVIFEISATWIAPLTMTRMVPARAGLWFLSWQLTWLSAGLAVFWGERGAVVAAGGLVAATILSRIGLWSFDLCAQVIIQGEVREAQRGSFSAVEASFQNLWEMLAYGVTIWWSGPGEFRYPVLVSVGAVYVAAGVFGVFARGQRGHLVHLPESCMKWRGGTREGRRGEEHDGRWGGVFCFVHPWTVDR